MELAEYLAIPYIMDVVAVEGPDGEWRCRLEYDELPGCVALGATPFEALDELERRRELYIRSRFEQGLPIPAPRPPLRS